MRVDVQAYLAGDFDLKKKNFFRFLFISKHLINEIKSNSMKLHLKLACKVSSIVRQATENETVGDDLGQHHMKELRVYLHFLDGMLVSCKVNPFPSF